ncbi:MAG: FecR family protein [Anaerolineales bacterium]|nr:FecR family protein [Anaerolineales bacterium]
MKSLSLAKYLLISFFLGACGTLPTTVGVPTESARQSAVLSARVSELEGLVDVQMAQDADFLPARQGMLLSAVSTLRTGVDGRSRLDLSDGTLVRVGPQSSFSLESMSEGEQGLSTRIKMTLGQMWIILNGGELEVETPSGLAAVRGSYMGISVETQTGNARVTCLEGSCSVAPADETLSIPVGQAAVLTEAGRGIGIQPMNADDLQGWLEANPESAEIVTDLEIPTEVPPRAPTAVATTIPDAQVTALPEHVKLPPLSCMAGGTCDQYCEAQPEPADCAAFVAALNAQGVNMEAFKNCMSAGGDAQACADNAR